jgi:hypothetical protein
MKLELELKKLCDERGITTAKQLEIATGIETITSWRILHEGKTYKRIDLRILNQVITGLNKIKPVTLNDIFSLIED